MFDTGDDQLQSDVFDEVEIDWQSSHGLRQTAGIAVPTCSASSAAPFLTREDVNSLIDCGGLCASDVRRRAKSPTFYSLDSFPFPALPSN